MDGAIRQGRCTDRIAQIVGEIMKLPIASASVDHVAARFTRYYRKAEVSVLAVEKDGEAEVVMMPAAEYRRLILLDHVAVTPASLSEEGFESLRTARQKWPPRVR